MANVMKRLGELPFFGVGLIAVLYAIYAVELVLFIAWLLRVLEIKSVFDRILPFWVSSHLLLALGGSVLAGLGVRKLARLK